MPNDDEGGQDHMFRVISIHGPALLEVDRSATLGEVAAPNLGKSVARYDHHAVDR